MRRLPAAVVLFALLGACSGERSDSAKSAKTPPPVPPDSSAPIGASQPLSDFATQVVRVLRALHGSVTAADWLRDHPEDTLQAFDRRLHSEGDERWCARSVRRMAAGDSSFSRYVYFYPPSPPADLALPPAQDAQLIRQNCWLGAVWMQTTAINPPHALGSIVAAQVRDSLRRMYGAGEEALGREVVFGGSHYWNTVGRWQVPPAVVVSAYDRGLDDRNPCVLAFAYLPFSGLAEPSNSIIESAERHEKKVSDLADQAARLSGLDSAKFNRLRSAAALSDSAYHGDNQRRGRYRAPEAGRLLVSAMREWITASQKLDLAHRAAALMAADQVISRGSVSYVLAQESAGPLVDTLKALGAGFVGDQLGGGQNYTHTWLDEAQRLDSGGPAGRLASVALLHIGLDRTGMCSAGDSASQHVSNIAERLLRSTRDSAEAAELHLFAGDGYADVVALAAGAGDDYADPSRYVAAAPVARDRAIAHYRRVLALNTDANVRQNLWLETWRLLAGLPPTRVHYFCVYD